MILHPFQQRPCISKETLQNVEPPPRCMASAFRRRTMQPTSPSIAKEARHVGFPLYRNGAEGTTISGKDASVPVISPAPPHNPNNPKYREPTPFEFQQARQSLFSAFCSSIPNTNLVRPSFFALLSALNAQTAVRSPCTLPKTTVHSSYTLYSTPSIIALSLSLSPEHSLLCHDSNIYTDTKPPPSESAPVPCPGSQRSLRVGMPISEVALCRFSVQA